MKKLGMFVVKVAKVFMNVIVGLATLFTMGVIAVSLYNVAEILYGSANVLAFWLDIIDGLLRIDWVIVGSFTSLTIISIIILMRVEEAKSKGILFYIALANVVSAVLWIISERMWLDTLVSNKMAFSVMVIVTVIDFGVFLFYFVSAKTSTIPTTSGH